MTIEKQKGSKAIFILVVFVFEIVLSCIAVYFLINSSEFEFEHITVSEFIHEMVIAIVVLKLIFYSPIYIIGNLQTWIKRRKFWAAVGFHVFLSTIASIIFVGTFPFVSNLTGFAFLILILVSGLSMALGNAMPTIIKL